MYSFRPISCLSQTRVTINTTTTILKWANDHLYSCPWPSNIGATLEYWRKKNGQINGSKLVLFSTIQQVIPNICTKFHDPDRVFYTHWTPMKDSYIIQALWRLWVQSTDICLFLYLLLHHWMDFNKISKYLLLHMQGSCNTRVIFDSWTLGKEQKG